MKKFIFLLISVSMLLSMAACAREDGGAPTSESPSEAPSDGPEDWEEDPDLGLPTDVTIPEGISIELSDGGITVDGEALSENRADVYTANDIVYYEAGHDFTYGEGTAADEHTPEEAAAHTVLHIAAPGTYVISGKLSSGQIAVDLGEDAEDDPEAVVNLVLNGLDITCTVAPAIIFYNVYECGDKDNAQSQVDTSAAGANVYIADGTVNTVNGSYVARIYKSVELSEDGKTVLDSKKLHKYDGALYSKMSMNVLGNDGVLNINAENEGLDSELHLTIGGGVINIVSGNDGINTNEDGVSVTTVNAGQLTVTVNGSTGEGDGIDSNGWLVINGGRVRAYACSTSGDAGIDSDMGILINGGEVVATGNMLDAIDAQSTQKYVLFNLNSRNAQAVTYTLKDAGGDPLMSVPTVNAFSILIVSSPKIDSGLYALYNGATLAASAEPGAGNMGGFGHGGMGGRPGGMGGGPEGGQQPPEGETPPEGQFPGGMGGEMPPDMPSDGQTPPEIPADGQISGEPVSDSAIVNVEDYVPGLLVDLRYATENARTLERAMTAHGFVGYAGEWWHYTDEDSYGVLL